MIGTIQNLVVIRGAGDLATGVAISLFRVGFPIIMLELEKPLVVRRTVSFAEAVFKGMIEIEDTVGIHINEKAYIKDVIQNNKIPVVVDPEGQIIKELAPQIIIDARLAKKNIDTKVNDASIVIGLGPGFTAGEDVNAVIETKRGHNLGKIIFQGQAEANTGVPGVIGGYSKERVIRSTEEGYFKGLVKIGDFVEAGQSIAEVNGNYLKAEIKGVVRGLLHDNVYVKDGMKVGDIDPRGIRDYCYSISDKSRSIGRAVLEAVLILKRKIIKEDLR